MRSIISLLLIVFCTCSFAQSKDVIYIGQSSIGGINNNDFLISQNQENIRKIQAKDKSIDWKAKSFILSSSSFKKLEKIILENCNSKKTNNENTTDMVVLRIYSDSIYPICYIVGKKDIKSYVEKIYKIKKLTKDSNSKKSVESLCNSMNRIVDYQPNK